MIDSIISIISIVIGWLAIFCFAILAIVFYRQQRTQGSLILALGLITLAIGYLMDYFIPQTFVSMEEAQNVISSTGIPLVWYASSIVVTIGLLTSVIGFGFIVFKQSELNT